jgi:hypothetical protein
MGNVADRWFMGRTLVTQATRRLPGDVPLISPKPVSGPYCRPTNTARRIVLGSADCRRGSLEELNRIYEPDSAVVPKGLFGREAQFARDILSIQRGVELDSREAASRSLLCHDRQFGSFVDLTHESLSRSEDPQPLHPGDQCCALKPKTNGCSLRPSYDSFSSPQSL